MRVRTIFAGSVFVFLLSLNSIDVAAQRNFLSGYLISLKGDTVRGYINYRNWEKNPTRITYRATLESENVVYRTLEILGFNVGNESYEGGVFEVDKSPYKIDDLTYSNEINLTTDTVFVRTLIAGEKPLYYYNDKNGKDQFLIKRAGKYESLLYKLYLKDINFKRTMVADRPFIGQLTAYLNDCPTIQDKINSVSFTVNGLQDLFKVYYTCRNINPVHVQEKERTKVDYGILGGLSVTNIKFKDQSGGFNVFDQLTKASYSSSVGFNAGLFLNIVFARNLDKWSVNNELIYSTYKIEGKYTHYTNANNYQLVNTTIGYSYIKINNMLRYKYSFGKAFIYINPGISNGIAIATKNYKKTVTKFYTPEETKEGKALDEDRKYEQGYFLGIGAGFSHYTFEVRYEKGNGMSDYTLLSSSTRRLQFMVGYKF